ncbi:MAG: outer membrane lipoprotein-sorting protein [Spirochaetes bacterium]|nr:outer membrane lipoprotein-sorting protein [Spirochaetota bacterium]
MKKNNSLVTAVLIILSLIPLTAFSQETREIELSAQEILAKADMLLKYPNGLMTGMLTHITPDGKSYNIDVEISTTNDNSLFVLANKNRGRQMKILFNLGGEDIWVYNILALKLYHKVDVDRFDPVLETNYSFTDLSNADFQSNYSGEIIGDVYIKGRESFKLNLDPIDKKGQYGKLVLYVDKKDFMPLRIDYHDRDKVVQKTMSVAQVAEFDGRKFPVRYDMLNITKGTLTIFKIFKHDKSVKFEDRIFRHEYLGDD